jgi:hypothetical protein
MKSYFSIDPDDEPFLSSKYGNNIGSKYFYDFVSPDNNGGWQIPGNKQTGDWFNFLQNADLGTIGCSFTHGSPLPYGFSWPRIIAATQGLKVNNFSRAGSGVNFEIPYALNEMKKFGMPKKIFAFFPNMDRVWAPSFISKETESLVTEFLNWDETIGTYRPNRKNAEDIFTISIGRSGVKQIPAEFAIFNSFMMIDMLDNICSIFDIEFKFSTWHSRELYAFKDIEYGSYIPPRSFSDVNSSDSKMINKWNDDYKNYPGSFIISNKESHELGFTNGLRVWNIFGPSNRRICNHEPKTKLQEKFWLVAEDRWHVGLHDQIHIAEHFLDKEINNDELKLIFEPSD